MTRYPNKNTSFLETIPHELVTDILSRVAASSVADLSNVKLSCKELKEIAENAYVYQHVCLDKFPLIPWTSITQKQQNFLNKCMQSSNPELFYREALIDFFDKAEYVSALQKLRKALRLGHTGAKYVICILLLFSPKVNQEAKLDLSFRLSRTRVTCILLLFSGIDELKREGIKVIGEIKKSAFLKGKLRVCRKKLVEELKQMWVNNPLMREKPICCGAHNWRNGWIEEKEDDECEGCSADVEVRYISSRI